MLSTNVNSTDDRDSVNQNEKEKAEPSNLAKAEHSSCEVGSISSSHRNPSCDKDLEIPDGSCEGDQNGSSNTSDLSTKTSLYCSVPLNKIRPVLGCSKADEDDNSLVKMKQTSRKLLCLYCDRTFVSSNLRQKHVERCHSEKQNRRLSSRKLQSQFTSTACFYCDKLPAEHSLRQLFEHLVSDHSEKYFGCLSCEERFLNQSLVNDHNSKFHQNTVPQKRVKTVPIVNIKKETEKDESYEESVASYEDINEQQNQKLTRSATKERNASSNVKPQLRQLRSKKIAIKASKISLKKNKRLQAVQARIPIRKRRAKSHDVVKVEETNTKSTEKTKSSSINPYPEFDNYYRVKKITDHSIDNLKISSLTFDDVFDKAFFSRIKCNIQENLMYHLDGKLFKNEESESRISNFEKNPPSQDVPSTSSENFGCDLSLNAITPVTSILTPNFGEDLESQIEYGSKPSKKKLQPRQDPVRHKYVTRRKYQASILEHKENRDLSKLDMWTQLVIKDRQQKVLNEQKSAKEMLEYTACSEYKLKIQRNELNRILDRRGPFEDLREESSKKAAFDKLNSDTKNEVSEECFKDVRSVVEDLLNEVVRVCAEVEDDSKNFIKLEESDIDINQIETSEIPVYLNLRRSSRVPSEEEIDKSDKIVLICSSQETENYELPTNTVRDKKEMVELSGEWARTRIYVCAACGLKLPNVKLLIDHKSLYHQNSWVQHYEFVGNQSELYRHLCIPGLGKVGHVENTISCKLWRRSDARVCTKCGKVCNALAELHRHILECGGDWTWMLVRKKCKYRPFGARKKRRGLVKRIRERFGNQKTEQNEKKKYKKTFEGPRQRPSDADTIQRMLANLPPKRSSRKIMCLKDGFPRNRKTNSKNKKQVMKCGKIVRQKVTYKTEEKKSKVSNGHNTISMRRTLRSLNRTLSSKILETNNKLRVKRTLIKNMNRRSSRLGAPRASKNNDKVDENIELEKITSVNTKNSTKTQKLKNDNSDRVKSILKEKINIKNFFPVSKRKVTKNSSQTLTSNSSKVNKTVDEDKQNKANSAKTVVKSLMKKSNFTKKNNKTSQEDPHIKNSNEPIVVIEKLSQAEEEKNSDVPQTSKLSNKRKLRSSFRKVIDRVKKLKLDNTSSSVSNVKPRNSFLGQPKKEKEKLGTVLVPLVEDPKENPPSTPAFVQNVIDNNSPTEESLIPENIFNFQHNSEDLLQAKSPLEMPLHEIKNSEVKNPFEIVSSPQRSQTKTNYKEITPILTKQIVDAFVPKIDTPTDSIPKTSIIVNRVDSIQFESTNLTADQSNSISANMKEICTPTVQESSSTEENSAKPMSFLTIETGTKCEKSPLVSPVLSPSMLSPRMKGKLRKPNRGLNDCIAMLTKKAFEETHRADDCEEFDKVSVPFVQEESIKDNKNIAHKFTREKECILKIPVFGSETHAYLQNEVLDLSKPKQNLEQVTGISEQKITEISSLSVTPYWNSSDEIFSTKKTLENISLNTWKSLSNGLKNNILTVKSDKPILKIPKIVETSWSNVEKTIQTVIDNSVESSEEQPVDNPLESNLKVPSVSIKNSLDETIEEVVRGYCEESSIGLDKPVVITSAKKKSKKTKVKGKICTETVSLSVPVKVPENLEIGLHDEVTTPAIITSNEETENVQSINIIEEKQDEKLDTNKLDVISNTKKKSKKTKVKEKIYTETILSSVAVKVPENPKRGLQNEVSPPVIITSKGEGENVHSINIMEENQDEKLDTYKLEEICVLGQVVEQKPNVQKSSDREKLNEGFIDTSVIKTSRRNVRKIGQVRRNAKKNRKTQHNVNSGGPKIEKTQVSTTTCQETRTEVLEAENNLPGKISKKRISEGDDIPLKELKSRFSQQIKETIVEKQAESKLKHSEELVQSMTGKIISSQVEKEKNSTPYDVSVEDEPLLLEEKEIEFDKTASTDSEDELPLVVLKNKNKVCNNHVPESLSTKECEQKSLPTFPVLKEENEIETEGNIESTSGYVERDLLASNYENKELTVNSEVVMNKEDPNSKRLSSPNINRRKSPRKLSTIDVESDHLVKPKLVKTKKLENAKSKLSFNSPKHFNNANEKENISNKIIMKSLKSVHMEEPLNDAIKTVATEDEKSTSIQERIEIKSEKESIESNNSSKPDILLSTIPILKVAKIKCKKKKKKECKSFRAKIILKLPKIILKEPTLKLGSTKSITSKSPDIKEVVNETENAIKLNSDSLAPDNSEKLINSVSNFEDNNIILFDKSEISTEKNAKKVFKRKKNLLKHAQKALKNKVRNSVESKHFEKSNEFSRNVDNLASEISNASPELSSMETGGISSPVHVESKSVLTEHKISAENEIIRECSHIQKLCKTVKEKVKFKFGSKKKTNKIKSTISEKLKDTNFYPIRNVNPEDGALLEFQDEQILNTTQNTYDNHSPQAGNLVKKNKVRKMRTPKAKDMDSPKPNMNTDSFPKTLMKLAIPDGIEPTVELNLIDRSSLVDNNKESFPEMKIENLKTQIENSLDQNFLYGSSISEPTEFLSTQTNEDTIGDLKSKKFQLGNKNGDRFGCLKNGVIHDVLDDQNIFHMDEEIIGSEENSANPLRRLRPKAQITNKQTNILNLQNEIEKQHDIFNLQIESEKADLETSGKIVTDLIADIELANNQLSEEKSVLVQNNKISHDITENIKQIEEGILQYSTDDTLNNSNSLIGNDQGSVKKPKKNRKSKRSASRTQEKIVKKPENDTISFELAKLKQCKQVIHSSDSCLVESNEKRTEITQTHVAAADKDQELEKPILFNLCPGSSIEISSDQIVSTLKINVHNELKDQVDNTGLSKLCSWKNQSKVDEYKENLEEQFPEFPEKINTVGTHQIIGQTERNEKKSFTIETILDTSESTKKIFEKSLVTCNFKTRTSKPQNILSSNSYEVVSPVLQIKSQSEPNEESTNFTEECDNTIVNNVFNEIEHSNKQEIQNDVFHVPNVFEEGNKKAANEVSIMETTYLNSTGISSKVKDAFEFEDDLTPIQELSPKFKRRNPKDLKPVVDGNDIGINSNPKYLKKKNECNRRNNSPEKPSKSSTTSDNSHNSINVTEGSVSIRRQRSAKCKALENINILNQNSEEFSNVDTKFEKSASDTSPIRKQRTAEFKSPGNMNSSEKKNKHLLDSEQVELLFQKNVDQEILENSNSIRESLQLQSTEIQESSFGVEPKVVQSASNLDDKNFEHTSPIRRQRNAKFKALENINTIEKNNESVSDIEQVEPSLQDGEAMKASKPIKRKRHSKYRAKLKANNLSEDHNAHLNEDEMDPQLQISLADKCSIDLNPVRKQRTAKSKALKSINSMEKDFSQGEDKHKNSKDIDNCSLIPKNGNSNLDNIEKILAVGKRTDEPSVLKQITLDPHKSLGQENKFKTINYEVDENISEKNSKNDSTFDQFGPTLQNSIDNDEVMGDFNSIRTENSELKAVENEEREFSCERQMESDLRNSFNAKGSPLICESIQNPDILREKSKPIPESRKIEPIFKNQIDENIVEYSHHHIRGQRLAKFKALDSINSLEKTFEVVTEVENLQENEKLQKPNGPVSPIKKKCSKKKETKMAHDISESFSDKFGHSEKESSHLDNLSSSRKGRVAKRKALENILDKKFDNTNQFDDVLQDSIESKSENCNTLTNIENLYNSIINEDQNISEFDDLKMFMDSSNLSNNTYFMSSSAQDANKSLELGNGDRIAKSTKSNMKEDFEKAKEPNRIHTDVESDEISLKTVEGHETSGCLSFAYEKNSKYTSLENIRLSDPEMSKLDLLDEKVEVEKTVLNIETCVSPINEVDVTKDALLSKLDKRSSIESPLKLTAKRKSRLAKAKAIENIIDLKERAELVDWTTTDDKDAEKTERSSKKTRKSENQKQGESIKDPPMFSPKQKRKERLNRSDKTATDSESASFERENSETASNINDCYDINKVDEEFLTEVPKSYYLNKNNQPKNENFDNVDILLQPEKDEKNIADSCKSDASKLMNNTAKNRAAIEKAIECRHDVAKSQDTNIESEHTDSLDNTLETAVVELNSIFSDDILAPIQDISHVENIGLIETSENLHSVQSTWINRSEVSDKKQDDIKELRNECSKNLSSKKNSEELHEDQRTKNGKTFKGDAEQLDESDLKRRSRRACKVNTYNENDLAEAIFSQAAAEKEKEKLKKKKLDENLIDPSSSTQKTGNKENKMNSDELFDLLKATVAENFNIPKPVEGPLTENISNMSSDLTSDNFSDVFDDILRKSQALFSEKTLTKEQVNCDSTQASYNNSQQNDISKSEEIPNSQDLYCDICKKSFKRIENLIKHKTTLTHISKLSEIEAKEAESKFTETNEEYDDSSKSYLQNIDDGKTCGSDSLYSYPPTPGNDEMKISEILTNAFHKPKFPEVAPISEHRRYKSLGERKSFESDQGSSSITENVENNPYETQIPNNAGVILEKQISLLQNIIENRRLEYIDDISLSSYRSIDIRNNHDSSVSAISSKLEESSNFLFSQKTVPTKSDKDDNFLKPPQIEDISQDSVNIRNNEDTKMRKVLNRDEELFLECCSLLKSGSEVSNFSKKSNRNSALNNIGLKISEEPDVFETKNLKIIEEESSDFSRTATPLVDSFCDTSNSNTISSKWKICTGGNGDELESNYFALGGVGQNYECEEASTSSSKLHSIMSKSTQMTHKEGSRLIRSRRKSSNESDGPENSASDSSSKLPTKGALKVFEGLRVSIPTEELNLEEVLSGSPVSKKSESGAFEGVASGKEFLSPKIPRSARKSKPVKNKQQIDDRFIFKVKKKSVYKENDKIKVNTMQEEEKIPDVYDFEETQDNTEVFAKPDFKAFRAKGSDIPKNENIFENNYEGQTLSSSSSSTTSLNKKSKSNECITKKKHMIMGRIFKNALKPKMDEDIRDIPLMDHNELVENYVLSCSPKVDDTFKKPKMTEEEMNYLFDKLLDKPESCKKLNSQNKTDPRTPGMKKKMKMKYKKRQRSNSDSTDDEFGLNRIVKKRPSKKSTKEEDNSINLEQELKECIGVASRKSQRKCTSGKQNVLVEYWSSDESAFETFLENHLQELSEKTDQATPGIESNSEENKGEEREDATKVVSRDTSVKKEKKVRSLSKASNASNEKKNISLESTDEILEPPVQPNRRKRTAAHPLYHWSSSSEDEMQDLIEVKSIRDDPEDEYDEDRPIQHGWIVGDSPKKLVTMLAQAKGKKTETESSVKEQGKKKNFNS